MGLSYSKEENKLNFSICVLCDDRIFEFTEAVLCSMDRLGAEIILFYGSFMNVGELIKKNIQKTKYRIIKSKAEPIENFAYVRNELDSLAPTEYVLHLDMDEILLSPPMIYTDEPGAFKRLNYIYDYNTTAVIYDVQARFYNKYMYRWEGKVHEKLNSKIWTLYPVMIHHFSFLKPLDIQEEIHRRYAEIRNETYIWSFPSHIDTVKMPYNIKNVLIKNGTWRC